MNDINLKWFNSAIKKRIRRQLRTFEKEKEKEHEDQRNYLQDKLASVPGDQLEKVIKLVDKLIM